MPRLSGSIAVADNRLLQKRKVFLHHNLHVSQGQLVDTLQNKSASANRLTLSRPTLDVNLGNFCRQLATKVTQINITIAKSAEFSVDSG